MSALSKSDHGYRSNPKLEEQTFCLVNVIAADKVSLMNTTVIDKLQYIREEASKQSKAESYRPSSSPLQKQTNKLGGGKINL